MNWLTNNVLPKINTFWQKRDTPDNLWFKCPECAQMVFHRDMAESLQVCPNCAAHQPVSPKDRFAGLFDDGAFETIETPEPLSDPLQFRDQKKYADRLKDARKATGVKDAVMVAVGAIGEVETVAAAQDFSFMAGSMGMAVGDAILKAAETAVARKAPMIMFAAAGGARMQEGILSLMQMPRTTIAVQMLREANLPYICVLTHPTTGGVTASYAMLGDIQIAEPNALICFAGPRVIEQTIREKLPEGFQRAEYLLEHGMLDMVVDRREMRGELIRLLRMLRGLPVLPTTAREALPAPVEKTAPEAPQPAPVEKKASPKPEAEKKA